MEKNNSAGMVMWIMIFGILIIIIGSFGRDLLFESYDEGRVEKYPSSNMAMEIESSVRTSALSKCEWCEIRTNTKYLTIIAKDKEEFDRIVNPNDFAAQSAEMFPDMFELESKRDKSTFKISRNFKFLTGGTTYVPAWLLLSLIENDILTNK